MAGSGARLEGGTMLSLAAGRCVRAIGYVGAVTAGHLAIEKDLEARPADDVGAATIPGIPIGRNNDEFTGDYNEFPPQRIKGFQYVFLFPLRAHEQLLVGIGGTTD
jgi:hypothetical protein